MNDLSFVKSKDIYSFFELLNKSNIEYMLIKNIGNELPSKLKNGKDIDIIVSFKHREKFAKTMREDGFLQRIHPLGKAAGWSFGYQLPEYQFWQKAGIRETFYIDACFKLMCKSLTPKFWVPLDESINAYAWENKVWDEELGSWMLDDKTLFVYMMARCVFDKRTFNQAYIKDIDKLKHLADDNDVRTMLSTIFYKYTSTLLELVKEDRFNEIIPKYIGFMEY